MQEFLYYNIKVAALVCVFYMFYRLLLSRQNFHWLNRIVLLATALLSFILPLCVITIHRTIIVDDASAAIDGSAAAVGEAALSGEVHAAMQGTHWLVYVAAAIYFGGALLCLAMTCAKIIRLRRFIASAERHPAAGGITIAVVDGHISPFSWMRNIVMSRADYAQCCEELLIHERAHIHLRHSYDVIVMEVLTALQWFNPAIWMMRADLRAIHEYEADQAVIESGIDVRRYVDLLIEKTQAGSGYSLANSINDSTLKQRIIIMLNTNHHCNWLRALYILPIVATSIVLSCNVETKRVANEEKQEQDSVRHYFYSEKLPKFPGGQEALNAYILKNTKYPAVAINANAEGIVMCTFLVDEKGNISDVAATQEFDFAETPKPGVDYAPVVASRSDKEKAATESEKAEGGKSLNTETERIVKQMPQWTPGTTKGQPAKSYATVIVGFSLK